MHNGIINRLLAMSQDKSFHDKKQVIQLPGLISASVNERIALDQIDNHPLCSFKNYSRVLLKIRLDKIGIKDSDGTIIRTTCMLLDDLSVRPQDLEVLFLDAQFMVDSYTRLPNMFSQFD